MCYSTARWKREVVPDHKFDFVDTREFTDNSFGMRMKYLWLYVIVLKGFLVYISDIFTAVTMLTTKSWSNAIFNSCPPNAHNGCVFIPFNVGRWLFLGCIIFSFLLLAYEAYKAKKIIKSRDISYAFTNVMANNYYSLRSYDHFCFFNHISNSTKRMDDFAFFVFFTFKSWKRVLLADGPRQTINALTLYAFYLSKSSKDDWWNISKYFEGNDFVTSGLIISTAFTCLVFAGSLLLLIVAGVCYIPLLMHIQGNLKEYCCHKVDKRISEIIKRKNKQRLAKARALAKKEAAGDFSHLKNKKGELIAQPLPQPTLPNVSLDDIDDASSMRKGGSAPSVYTTQTEYYYSANKEYGTDYPPTDYPPMPAYGQQYTQHNASMGVLPDDHHYDDNDYGSTANLALSAAPIAGPGPDELRSHVVSPKPTHPEHQQPPHNYLSEQYGYASDPTAAYRGPSPVGNVSYGQAYTAETQYLEMHHESAATYHHHQASYGYPQNDRQPGGGTYDYGAGQAHAM